MTLRWIRPLRRAAAICALAALALGAPAAAQSPVVHAVYYFSPTCPHCHVVSTVHLPPIAAQYGDQLDIAMVDVTTFAGQQLYQNAVAALNIPDSRRGVPTIVAGDQVLVGENEIPQSLPGIIDTALAQGGLDWPAIPGLAGSVDSLPRFGRESTIAGPSVLERIGQDPLGNGLAILVLAGMLYTVYTAVRRLQTAGKSRRQARKILKGDAAEQTRPWLIPALAAAGLLVSAYLSFAALSGNEAFCGPVGDCNVVQQSQYARLFGRIPVSLIGASGFAAILVTWAIERFGQESLADRAVLVLVGLSLVGTLFSIYLTFLEPFVLGATCLWCLSSAILISALLWTSSGRGRIALTRLRAG